MNEDNNALKDLLNEKELEEYNKTEYPFNLSILHTALKQKLQEDPNYEVWVPLVYYKCEVLVTKKNEPLLIQPYKTFISNRGNIQALQRNPPVIESRLTAEGYVAVSVTHNKKSCPIMLHRAIACSFLGLGDFLLAHEGVQVAHPKDLQVNHINGVKHDFDFSNLEWETPSGNARHASDTGLIKTIPVKGKVIKGDFVGLEFILKGRTEVEKYGFHLFHISNVISGNLNHHRNCVWSLATEEEIRNLPRGISNETRSSLADENSRIKSDILGKHIETGETITIRGGQKELISLGFNPQNVYTVIAGRVKSHKGYTFQRTME